jgi:hypothetical protein
MSIMVTGDIAVEGLKVVRGKDWKWSDQDIRDYGQPQGAGDGTGIIQRICVNGDSFPTGWVKVLWKNGNEAYYRVGYDNCYDLYVYFPTEVSASRESKVADTRQALDKLVKGTGESLKSDKHGHTTDAYTGNCLYLPPESYTLQRGERFEGRRLQS